MTQFSFPARFSRDKHDGGYVITFRDVPEAITQGESLDDCFEQGAGAVQAALEARMLSGIDIPNATQPRRGERLVAVPIQTALKAALYIELRRTGTTRVALARRLHIDEKEARRMLDPHHPTKADRLERALAILGKHVELHVA